MESKQRLITALEGKVPDRLPVTTHHVFDPWLSEYMGGLSRDDFFNELDLDAIRWINPVRPDESRSEYLDNPDEEYGFLYMPRIVSENWKIDEMKEKNKEGELQRITIKTPKGNLNAVLQETALTTWILEPLLKKKNDIDLLEAYQTQPLCDVEEVKRQTKDFGNHGIVRGFIIPSELYGQPGVWQDFCCLRGTVQAIMDTYDDSKWVHHCLDVILQRKLHYVGSMAGAPYDLIELGGGDASTTVISPAIFNEYVAPYDSQIISDCHEKGQRITYHTCGGMMPILEDIADMKPDAMETFTPIEMGGDVDLAEAKRRIGNKVCMIGGFNQVHYLKDTTPAETRREVRRCFEAAGEGGGLILSPSDHFFDADPELIRAFADEAHRCTYQELK